MKLKTLLTVAALTTAAAAASHAATPRTLTHDGTSMAMSNTDDEIEIIYSEVPPALRELGVVPGTRLLHGKWEDTILVGTAYVFAKGCAPIAYPVRGVVDRSGALIVIGPAPTDCSRSQYAWGPSSVMRFDPPQQRQQPKPKVTKPKPKPPQRPAAPRSQQPMWPQQQQWRWW
jgi:hypothetical protein